jgi:hypothetical protein
MWSHRDAGCPLACLIVRRFVTRHGTWSASLVGLVLAVVAFFAWVNPGLWYWFATNPAVGWVGLLAALLVVCLLIADRWRLQDDVRALEQKVTDLQAAAAAAAKPEPTARDKALAADITAIWDPTGRLFRFFEMGFNAKRWQGDKVDPLFEFVAEYEHRYFDDAVVQEAFASLYAAANDLGNWMAYQAAPIAEDNIGKQPGEPLTYSIKEAHIVGGWKEWDALRDQGMTAALATLTASREFEQVARRRGL